MANYPTLIQVELTDTFDTWRGKTNTAIRHTDYVASIIGDLDQLDTTSKKVQGAVNELHTETTANTTNIGLLADINTPYNKSTIVASLNSAYDTLKAYTDSEIADEEVARISGDNTLQLAINQVEASAGLTSSGGYIQQTAANYINGATSLATADNALDIQAKSLQTELDFTQQTLGTNAVGAKTFSGSYIANKNYANAIESLDTQTKLNTDSSASNQGQISANLATETTHYNSMVSVANNLATEAGNLQLATGADSSGNISIQSTNYINGLTVKAALVKLDETSKSHQNSLAVASVARSTLQGEINTTQGGAGLSAAGTYIPHYSGYSTSSALSLHAADIMLDAAIYQNVIAIQALSNTTDGLTSSIGGTISLSSLSADNTHILYSAASGRFTHNTITNASVSTAGTTIVRSITTDTAGHVTNTTTGTLGNQSQYNQTISSANPSGGSNGDVWYKI
jgi:hypothetical protein|tara:strand:- start:14964 stop:16334 length:1371 start_codon:yes stop_codon:yes gene_type:complete